MSLLSSSPSSLSPADRDYPYEVATETERRRRRTPEEAAQEILDAAEAFLRERPFRDLTIDEVMDGTGLSRPSFYVYFRDRHHLALKLIEELGSEMFAAAGPWLEGEGDDPEELRGALRGTAGVFEAHGPVLRAIADAATEDAEVEQAYRGIVEGFVDATAAAYRARRVRRPLDRCRPAPHGGGAGVDERALPRREAGPRALRRSPTAWPRRWSGSGRRRSTASSRHPSSRPRAAPAVSSPSQSSASGSSAPDATASSTSPRSWRFTVA